MWMSDAVDDALVQDEVHEADDGRVLRGSLKLRNVVAGALQRLVGLQSGAQLREHVGHGLRLVAVVLGDTLRDIVLSRHHEANFLREHERELVGDARVYEVGGCERYRRVVALHWKHVVHARHGRRDRLHHVRVQRHVLEVDDFAPLVAGEYAEEVVLVHQPVVHHELADRLSA